MVSGGARRREERGSVLQSTVSKRNSGHAAKETTRGKEQGHLPKCDLPRAALRRNCQTKLQNAFNCSPGLGRCGFNMRDLIKVVIIRAELALLWPWLRPRLWLGRVT